MSPCHLFSIFGYEQMISWTMQTADQGIGSVSKMQQQGWLFWKPLVLLGKFVSLGFGWAGARLNIYYLPWDETFWMQLGNRKIRTIWVRLLVQVPFSCIIAPKTPIWKCWEPHEWNSRAQISSMYPQITNLKREWRTVHNKILPKTLVSYGTHCNITDYN